VARIEVIRLFLAYASFMNFLVYQMDVKSAFIYGTIEEEYQGQPSTPMKPPAIAKDEEVPAWTGNLQQTKIHVYNESAIYIVKNPVYHSKIKNIEIRHHFIRDSYEKRLIEMVKIYTDNNVADLLTKAFIVMDYTQVLFGLKLEVKHGEKLVSTAKLIYAAGPTVSTAGHKVSAARQT
ncbi:copia protein, partial [Tanacetum coccineum]